MHHCSCHWWHLLKGLFLWSCSFLGLIVIYASAQGDFRSQGCIKQPYLVQDFFFSARNLILQIDIDVGFLLTYRNFDWCLFNGSKSETMIPSLSVLCQEHNMIKLFETSKHPVSHISVALQGSQSAGCITDILQGRCWCENHGEKQSNCILQWNFTSGDMTGHTMSWFKFWHTTYKLKQTVCCCTQPSQRLIHNNSQQSSSTVWELLSLNVWWKRRGR